MSDDLTEQLGEIRALDEVFQSARHRATIDKARDRIDELEATQRVLIDAIGLAMNYWQERHVFNALRSAYKDGTA